MSLSARSIALVVVGGRLVLIGLMGGAKAELSLAQLLGKRLARHSGPQII